jgi:sigma-B regulation protein RsbU (phosphoserine phosphatase)
MKVLVTEDEEISAIVLRENLTALGYDVTLASDGLEGWEAYLTGDFQVLILDWMMPKLDGIELCRRIRSNNTDHYAYIILLTGRSEREDRLEALEAGADDFLTKPVDAAELRARLSVAKRIIQSDRALRQSNQMLQEATRMQAQLGSQIQQTLLLGTPPPPSDDVALSSVCVPSQMVAGDFIDFYSHLNGVTDVLAGDVMGKGIPAAMVAAGVKSAIEKSLVKLLGQGRLPSVSEVLQHATRNTARELIELGTFVTLCYARIDAERSLLRYVNCGHPQIIRWVAAEDRCELLPSSTVPIGFIEDDTYPESVVQLGAGDLILIYSDGITDLGTSSTRILGQDGFLEWLAPRAHRPLKLIVDDLMQLLENHRAEDDVTCVAIRITGQRKADERLIWGEPGALSAIREIVKRKAAAHERLNKNEIGELVLAVQEAGSNAIRHARPDSDGIPLGIRVLENDDAVRVELLYPGMRFDPSFAGDVKRSIEDEGGFGLDIIKRCVDKIEYAHENGWNRLTLEKRGK